MPKQLLEISNTFFTTPSNGLFDPENVHNVYHRRPKFDMKWSYDILSTFQAENDVNVPKQFLLDKQICQKSLINLRKLMYCVLCMNLYTSDPVCKKNPQVTLPVVAELLMFMNKVHNFHYQSTHFVTVFWLSYPPKKCSSKRTHRVGNFIGKSLFKIIFYLSPRIFLFLFAPVSLIVGQEGWQIYLPAVLAMQSTYLVVVSVYGVWQGRVTTS